MVLDYCYGLKDSHRISSFEKYSDETGLEERLLSEDAVESSKAMYELMRLYLADGHCKYLGNSWRIGEDADTRGKIGVTIASIGQFFEDASNERAKFYPDGVPGYEEIGDTAYITFDSFATMPAGEDYYSNPPAADTKDTAGICLYAFAQITREGSPVRNVVLNLSNNAGGDSTTASFVLSMFLGEANVCVEDTLTGTVVNECFRCDANLDGAFDDKDSLTDYRLFCLTAPCSFSCGNLVPAVLKGSKKMRTIGMTSAGGSCIVMPISLADGTMLRISGYRRLGPMINGAVYDTDKGVEPDYPISTLERFFDRKALTEYIDSLY